MARILSMADQIDLRLKRRLSSHRERDEILEWVTMETGTLFYPEVAAAFKRVAQKEAFWLDIEQPDLRQIASGLLFGKWQLPATRELETGFTDDLAATFADLIDQKSKFTARHSRSVAETVERLARGLGWEEERLHETVYFMTWVSFLYQRRFWINRGHLTPLRLKLYARIRTIRIAY